ncbi:MAG: hypothetical protein ABR879_01920 [Methanomassiliicoccales archaeon]
MARENAHDGDTGVWKMFLSRHWRMTAAWVLGAAVAVFGAVLVYLWFVGQAQTNGIVPSSLALWTIGSLVAFILNLIFWELVLIGIPVVIAAIVAYSYYKRLPYDEREEYRRASLFKSRSRRTDWGSGFSFLLNIVFIIKIYADGNWNTPFSTWTFDYLVYSFIVALIAIVVIIGVPMLIGGVWWLHREMKA